MDVFLGAEIGATKQQLCIGRADGTLERVVSEHVDTSNGAKGILEFIEYRGKQLIQEAESSGQNVKGIGAGFGGIIQSATGRVLFSVQVDGWKDRMLKSWFEERFKIPAVVVNDTVCGGYGEYKLGCGKGAECFFYTNIGSGIGGGLFLGGKAYDGQGLGAAYFGNTYIPNPLTSEEHTAVKIESICSGWAIEKRLHTPGYVPLGSSLIQACSGDVTKLDCRQLHTAAREKDIFALSEIDMIARSFGIGLGNLMTMLHPDMISIGGGVSNMGDILIDPIRRYAKKFAFEPNKSGTEIVRCSFVEEAVLLGAIQFAAEKT